MSFALAAEETAGDQGPVLGETRAICHVVKKHELCDGGSIEELEGGCTAHGCQCVRTSRK